MYDCRCIELPSGNHVALKVANYSTEFQVQTLDSELNHLRFTCTGYPWGNRKCSKVRVQQICPASAWPSPLLTK